MAGESIVKFLKKNINKNPSPNSLCKLFRIEDNEYYYGKTTNNSIEVYKIPDKTHFLHDISIENIEDKVPKSQLNIYTYLKHKTTNKQLTIRNELRYSHGQLNGTPEAKMYISDGSLLIAYEKI